MIFDLLFRNFAVWACASNGVVNLRKLILQLGLSGTLASQDLSDEPVDKLLKRIQEELSNRDQQKKKQNQRPPIDLAALPELPESWIWIELSDICLIRSGNTPKNFDYSVNIDEIPFFKISDMNNPGNEKLLLNPKITINREEALAFGIQIQEPGTVVFPKRGGAIATNKKRILAKPSAYDANIMGIRIPIIPPKFLFYWLSSFDLNSLSSGSAVPQINHQDILPLPFPLPPLAEQKRITAKIDLLMALCDDLETRQQEEKLGRIRLGNGVLTALQNATSAADFYRFWSFIYRHFESIFDFQENITALREAILQLAMQGKLVLQNPSEEASSLLKCVQKAKALRQSQKVKFFTRLEEEDHGGLPFGIPSNWILVTLDDIASKIHYGYSASAEFAIKQIKLLRITDIQANKVNWDNVPGCLIDDHTYPSYSLNNGDLLVARTGGTVGKTFLVKDLPQPTVFASYLIRIVPNECIKPDYLKLYADSPLYWSQLYERCKGTGQPNVNATSLRALKIPLPPLQEQNRIITQVDKLVALCDELETKIKQREAISESFSDSVTKSVSLSFS